MEERFAAAKGQVDMNKGMLSVEEQRKAKEAVERASKELERPPERVKPVDVRYEAQRKADEERAQKEIREEEERAERWEREAIPAVKAAQAALREAQSRYLGGADAITMGRGAEAQRDMRAFVAENGVFATLGRIDDGLKSLVHDTMVDLGYQRDDGSFDMKNVDVAVQIAVAKKRDAIRRKVAAARQKGLSVESMAA